MVPQEIKQIIVQTYYREMKIDKNDSRTIQMLGDYRMDTFSHANLAVVKSDDVATFTTVGTTMYVVIKELPRMQELVGKDDWRTNLTLVLPNSIPTEVRDSTNQKIEANGLHIK